MSAIGLDILNIGSSKWDKKIKGEQEFYEAPLSTNFMLPSAENVNRK